jgi:tetratricopeptide (TPR) repeat protein
MTNLLNDAFKFHSEGNFEKAEEIYLEILKNEPQNAQVLNLLGVLKLAQRKYQEAQNLITQALSIKRDTYFYENLARVYIETNNFQKACELLIQATQELECGFEIYFLLGLAYKNATYYEQAELAYLKALQLNPKSEKACFNLASLYLFLNKPHKAIEYFQKCLEIKPNDVETLYFLSLGYFRIKDYKTGTKYFENRLCRNTAITSQQVTYPNLMQKAKLWQGEDISDKTLYTYYEAGFGDMIMFARYIPELKKRCKKLLIKPQKELSQLFRDNFEGVEVMDLFYDEDKTDFDVHIPFLSVPYVLGFDNNQMFMHHDKYLSATQEKINYYKENFFNNNKFKIAIKWQGNTYYETDRVINVEAFAPLFNLKNAKIYSAQTFEGSEEFNKLSSKYDITDLSKSFKDFSYTAGALENVDLVICSDTSLAHLAGAMGKPCIVLLPYQYNWRWHMDLSVCDWYDSVKLFRLERGENWNELMLRVYADIVNQVNK